MDYSLRATYSNISRTYFHHGTIGNCQYCFWGRSNMAAPYYGATTAVALLAGAGYLTALDSGLTAYAGYAAFDCNRAPLRILLYNSDFYVGNGTRTSQSFILTGLQGASVMAKRLTAGSALSRVDHGDRISFGGQYFADGTCAVGGLETFETTAVADGQATFVVRASEALLVYLQ
jgi:hypothetical protein